MSVWRLEATAAAKPWGRSDLSPWSAVRPPEPIGEMIYTPPGGDDAELLVKVLFTGERLSVQVHPGRAAAQAAGHARGKDEAWIILDAEPDAVIGLGLRAPLDPAGLAAAARDGSIEGLMDWRPVRAGDVLFAPAGTIHAIGAGITLVEVQQNLDLTYRLFDYGRPRELHLAEAVAVADTVPWQRSAPPRAFGDGRTVVVEGGSFVVERVSCGGEAVLDPPPGRAAWLVLLGGGGTVDGRACGAGEVWLADSRCALSFDTGAELLLAYAGDVAPEMWAVARKQAA